MPEESKNEISWRAAEFRYFKKTLTWYLWVVGIAVLLLIFAIWQNNFFFAIFIAIASIIIIFMGKRRPRIVDFKVNEEGIYIDKDTFYPYKDLKWFSIRARPDSLNEIVFKRSATINPVVKIQADSQITPKVRKLLKDNLEEKEYEDSLVDSFADLFRF